MSGDPAAVRHRQHESDSGGASQVHRRCEDGRSIPSVGYYFRSKVEECLARNQQRSERVPDVGILSTAKKLELPTLDEGFDTLRYVRLTEGGFVVEEWNDEV